MVTISKTEETGKTTIACPGNVEIANNQNLAVQMVDHWRSFTGFEDGIEISIEENSDTGGLGGGSSNAVSTLIGLNLLSQKKLNFKELHELSSKVGSDCPSFFSLELASQVAGESIFVR